MQEASQYTLHRSLDFKNIAPIHIQLGYNLILLHNIGQRMSSLQITITRSINGVGSPHQSPQLYSFLLWQGLSFINNPAQIMTSGSFNNTVYIPASHKARTNSHGEIRHIHIGSHIPLGINSIYQDSWL